jgi:hypothetical protein
MILYRYRHASTNTFSEISEGQAWYSKYSELNDPFEGIYVNQSCNIAVDALIQTLRVCCFSERNDNLLMWAHYADNHRGICLEYDIPDDVHEKTFMQIIYGESQPILKKVEVFPAGDPNAGKLSLKKEDVAVFLTKSADWAYEREWRTLRITDKLFEKGELHTIPGKLSAVYFGLRTDEAAKKIICRLASPESGIEFWQASLRAGHFSLEFNQANCFVK